MRAVPRVLVLGGSTEASALVRELAQRDSYDVIVSFAGRTRVRSAMPARVRVGGFGGPDGLARYLRDEHVDVLVDATHPFAAHMPHNAVAACTATGVPRLRLCRPSWAPTQGDRWHEVDDLEAAARALGALGVQRAFLTTGRQDLAPFAGMPDIWFLVRAIEPPDPMPLARASVIHARGPFDERDELALMRDHDIDALVAKNSGGTAAAPKLAAARSLGIPVVMVRRPQSPDGPLAVTVDDALAWLDGLVSAPAGSAQEAGSA